MSVHVARHQVRDADGGKPDQLPQRLENEQRQQLHRRYYRVGAANGVLGVVLLVLGTALHPVPPDGNDAVVAFTVYAEMSRSAWLAAHLLPLAGITGMVLAMVLLSGAVATTGAGGLWARLTEVTGAAAIAVTAALQAVDGVALKATVDMWWHASAADRSALFPAAQAVRQVEIGLDAVFSFQPGSDHRGLRRGAMGSSGRRPDSGWPVCWSASGSAGRASLSRGFGCFGT